VTKPYYEADGITIYHGDCRQVLPTLKVRPALVLTDPPYAIGASRGEWAATASVAIGLSEAAKKVTSKGSLVAFTTTSGRGIEYTIGAVGRRLPFNRLLTWHKRGGRSRAVSPWAWDSVGVLVFGRAPDEKLGESSVLSTDPYERESEHPAELPPAVCEWAFAPFAEAGLTVLDPFMGSARLLEPAVRRGLRVIGIERDERWCELAANRLLALAQSVGAVREDVALPFVSIRDSGF